MEDFLKQLEGIKRAEPSPFLFTRIQQRIQNHMNNYVSKSMAWSLLASFSLVLFLNIYIIRQNTSTNAAHKNIAETFNLLPSNNFYK